jgi:hypothetical protein
MLVRDFLELSESTVPWLDGVGGEIPYNNLTVTMILEGCHINLLDDWGSFESEPEMRAEHMVGVGLYTADTLSEGHIPVGMGSKEELTATFIDLTERIKNATAALWREMAGWTRDQQLDAGAITYYAVIREFALIAGCYEMEDWMLIDERAERFRPLLNDEYSNMSLWEILGPLSNPCQRTNEYQLCQHANIPARMYSLIPYSVLKDGDYTATVGDLQPGVSYLPRKEDRYRTTQGVLSLAEYNRQAREFTPTVCDDDHRWLCESWLKYHHDTPAAEALRRPCARAVIGGVSTTSEP